MRSLEVRAERREGSNPLGGTIDKLHLIFYNSGVRSLGLYYVKT